METITIRQIGPEALADLLAVEDGLFDNPIDATQAEAFLSRDDNVLFFAFDGTRAVGMGTGSILLHPDKKPSLFINEVGVCESHQRRGIGKAIVQALLDWARERGLDGIWLGTESDNDAARALYRSLDAEEVSGVFYGWDDAL
jgi:ribosomal protein S18 acetylase RimI-like enzyme